MFWNIHVSRKGYNHSFVWKRREPVLWQKLVARFANWAPGRELKDSGFESHYGLIFFYIFFFNNTLLITIYSLKLVRVDAGSSMVALKGTKILNVTKKSKKAKSIIEIQGVGFHKSRNPGCGSFHTIHTVRVGPGDAQNCVSYTNKKRKNLFQK